MAVEIPTVVDIESGFKDAANRVPTAAKPLEEQVERVSQRISNAIMKMQKTAARGTGESDAMNDSMARYANTVRLAAQQLLKLAQAQGTIKVGSKDIRSISQEISVLAEKWNSMPMEKKFDENGKLRNRAQDIIDKMSKLVAKATSFGDTLASGSRAAAEAEQAHANALELVADTLDKLNTKLAAWRQELETAEIGSEAFKKASREVQKLVEQLQHLNTESVKLGSDSNSITQLSAKLQDISHQYSNLSSSERNGYRGKDLVRQYKETSAYMEKEVKNLQQIVALEKRLQEYSLARTRTRQYEEAVLKSEANTMHRLTEQQRILTERLNNAKFGTKTYDDLKKRLESVNAELAKMKGSVDKTNVAFTQQSTILRSLTSMASMYISVFGFLRFAKQIRDVTGELEFQRISLGRLIQDMEYGNVLFEKIKKAAVESPFRIKDLVTYTKQLAAYRIEQENLFDVTKRLADISAGLGVDMNRLILAYGQVRSASVLRGQELRQFTEAGIPLVELLAEKMGELNQTSYSTADVFKLISARAVPFSAIAEIFEDLTDKGGMFYEMQKKQAETLKGRWEKLKDQYDIALQSIGESKGLLSFKTYNEVILALLNKLAKGLRIVPKLIEGCTLAWIAYSIATRKQTKAIRDNMIAEIKEQVTKEAVATANVRGIKYTNAYTKAIIRQKAATTALGRSFWKLWAAIVANPWGAAIAAVLGLVAAFVSFRKASSSATSQLADFKTGVENLAEASKTYEKNEKLINTYETLASKTERTEDENRKLEDTLSRLKDIFPGLTSQIDDETASLDDNVRALREKNEEELKVAREEAEQRLNAAQITKNQLEKQLKDQEAERERRYKSIEEEQEFYNELKKKVAEGTLPASQLVGEEEKIEQLTKKYTEWDDKVRETKEDLKSVNDAIVDYEKYLYGDKNQTTELEQWKKIVQEMNEYKTSLGTFQIFTPQEIKDFETVYDYFKDLKKKWTDAKESAEALKAAYESATEAIAKAKLMTEWKDAEALFEAIDAQVKRFGFVMKSGGSGGGYQQDPFIKRMEERMKFMQDFKKGYDDLSKYISGEGAMDKQLENLKDRGISLGLEIEEQKKAGRELSEWYTGAMALAWSEAQKHGASGSMTDFLRQDIKDSTNRGKALKDFQKLIQSLFDAKTDLDTSELKKNLEDALKKVEEEIKRSETARNFYHNILDITGDEELAATMSVSVYGDVGREFKDRIQKQLDDAFQSIDWTELPDDLFNELSVAFVNRDFDTILDHLNLFPEKWQEMLKKMADDDERHAAELMKNFAELVAKYGDTAQKIATIRAKADNEIGKVKEALDRSLSDISLTPEQRAALESRAKEIIKALEANRDLEEFKQSENYIKFFSEINIMTAKQAATIRGELRNAYLKAFQEGAISADELRKNLRAVDEQFHKLSESSSQLGAFLTGGFDAANKKLQDYADMVTVLAAKMKAGKNLDDSEQVFATKMLKTFGGDEVKNVKSFEQLLSAFSSEGGGIEAAGKAFGQMGEGMSAAAASGPGALAIVDAIFKAVHGTITGIQQVIDSLNEMRSEANKIGGWFKYVSDFDKYTFSGWEKLKSGDVLGATADAISSWISIFNNAQRDKVERINKAIKDQNELVEDLEYSYSRLEAAIEKSFGSEYIYNYNKQLEILQAKAEAYQKQAELEREKGKSADEDVAKGYEKSAREIQDQITDMQTKLQEFFAGTDITSAAEDFASAWIDAYKEFGSTTDAMSEKFNDMIESMINRSLAAKIMQEMLQPIFDQIDTMSRDGLLSTEEITSIAELAQERIPMINDAMTNLMASLASAGFDVRTSTAGLSGISKSIASASEESILGLAAGINTQNFYMSYMPTISENVAAILAAMGGKSSVMSEGVMGEEVADVMPSVQKMIYDHLPLMDQNLSELLRLVRSVVTTKNGSTNTNYIAVK